MGNSNQSEQHPYYSINRKNDQSSSSPTLNESINLVELGKQIQIAQIQRDELLTRLQKAQKQKEFLQERLKIKVMEAKLAAKDDLAAFQAEKSRELQTKLQHFATVQESKSNQDIEFHSSIVFQERIFFALEDIRSQFIRETEAKWIIRFEQLKKQHDDELLLALQISHNEHLQAKQIQIEKRHSEFQESLKFLRSPTSKKSLSSSEARSPMSKLISSSSPLNQKNKTSIFPSPSPPLHNPDSNRKKKTTKNIDKREPTKEIDAKGGGGGGGGGGGVVGWLASSVVQLITGIENEEEEEEEDEEEDGEEEGEGDSREELDRGKNGVREGRIEVKNPDFQLRTIATSSPTSLPFPSLPLFPPPPPSSSSSSSSSSRSPSPSPSLSLSSNDNNNNNNHNHNNNNQQKQKRNRSERKQNNIIDNDEPTTTTTTKKNRKGNRVSKFNFKEELNKEDDEEEEEEDDDDDHDSSIFGSFFSHLFSPSSSSSSSSSSYDLKTRNKHSQNKQNQNKNNNNHNKDRKKKKFRLERKIITNDEKEEEEEEEEEKVEDDDDDENDDQDEDEDEDGIRYYKDGRMKIPLA